VVERSDTTGRLSEATPPIPSATAGNQKHEVPLIPAGLPAVSQGLIAVTPLTQERMIWAWILTVSPSQEPSRTP
jgi:hypothetical protein